MGIVKNYEDIRKKTVAIVGVGGVGSGKNRIRNHIFFVFLRLYLVFNTFFFIIFLYNFYITFTKFL